MNVKVDHEITFQSVNWTILNQFGSILDQFRRRGKTLNYSLISKRSE